MATPNPVPSTDKPKSRLEILEAKQKKIADDLRKERQEEKRKALKAARTAAREARKLDSHIKVLIGAALMADAKIKPETRQFIEAVLPRAVVKPAQVETLKAAGWIKG
jgi:hypothetical protein